MSAFDQARNVGDDETDFVPGIAHLNHSQIRLQRSKRIVGNFRPRRRDAGNQSRFANVGIAHQSHVCKQLQLQPVGMFFTGASGLVLAGSLMHGSREARVAPSAPSATGNHHALIRCRKVEHLLSRLLVVHNRSDWNLQKHVHAFAAGFVRAFAVASTLRFVFGIETEVDQGVVAFAGFHDHVAALPPIPARRSASRNIFFATKGHAAIASVARLDTNLSLVDEHGSLQKQKPRPEGEARPRSTARDDR